MILMMFSSVQPGRHHLNKKCSVGAAVSAASGGSWPLHLGGVGRFWPGRRANRTQWWAADADLHRWPSQLEFLKKTKISGLKQSLILKQLNSWTRIILTIIFGWGRWKEISLAWIWHGSISIIYILLQVSCEAWGLKLVMATTRGEFVGERQTWPSHRGAVRLVPATDLWEIHGGFR